jgi:transposase
VTTRGSAGPGWRSVAAASTACGTTGNTCHAAVAALADPVLGQQLAPIRVLGIDETRRGRAKWETAPQARHLAP